MVSGILTFIGQDAGSCYNKIYDKTSTGNCGGLDMHVRTYSPEYE